MGDLLGSLFGGIVIIIATYLVVNKMFRWRGKETGVLVSLAVLGVYVPLAIINWPGADVFAIHLSIYLVSVYVLSIITMQRDARLGEKGNWFHWGPASMISFFALILAVNAVFIVVAQKGLEGELANLILPEAKEKQGVTSFFPGTVQYNYQQKESQYNAYRERVLAVKKRAWTVRKGWVGVAVVNQPLRFRVQIEDRDNQLVKQASIRGNFLRASNSKLDQPFTMQEVSPGTYETNVMLPEPGRWELQLHISHDQDEHEIAAYTEIAAQ